jgi:hypothetical protein
MQKAFSVASWNVRHFKNEPARVKRIVAFLNDQKPDIFGIYEVTGADMFGELTRVMPDYTCQITEGPETQEILVGVRKGITCFLTQKIEFKTGVSLMRPGLLASIVVDTVNYPILFLHLASKTEPRGMGLRDDMLRRAFKFKSTLEKAAKAPTNYIFVGDLNTMGMEYPFKKDIPPEIEIKKWDTRAHSAAYRMKRLSKSHVASWSPLSTSSLTPSALDHVYAADHLQFTKFSNGAEVDVRGWVQKTTTADRDRWIKDYSDHSLLYFEILKA